MVDLKDDGAVTREDICKRIKEIEDQLAKLTVSGSSAAWGALAGLGLASLIPAVAPVLGLLLGAGATTTGTTIAAVILKKKRELQNELDELKEKLRAIETDNHAKSA